MKLTKDFKAIKENFPDATFRRNSSGPGVLIYLLKNRKYLVWYVNKIYSLGHRDAKFFSVNDLIDFAKTNREN